MREFAPVMTRETKRVLCIAGSLRRDSWNRRLLAAACGLSLDGLSLYLYERLSQVPMFSEDLEVEPSPDVEHLRDEVRTCDGLLLATPEYNHSLPAVLKNVVDWLSRGDPNCLHGKPVAIIGATVGNWGTRLAQAALRQTLLATGARVMIEPMLFIARAPTCFNARGELSDPTVAGALTGVLRAFEPWMTSSA